MSVAICLAILILRDNGHAQAEAVLYTFTGSSDGGIPYAGLAGWPILSRRLGGDSGGMHLLPALS